jgi:small-conductance mechanosensitive channel
MNLIGKIFTVLIFVMSVTFMAFTVMSYATRKNWRLVADNPTPTLEQPHGGLSQQLADERKLNQKLQDDNEKANRALASQETEDRQVRADLETENARLNKEKEEHERVIAEKTRDAENAIAALKAEHETLARLREEAETLRGEIKKAHEERDASFKQVVTLTDQLNSAANDRTRLTERNVQLAADYAKAVEALRYNKIDWKGDYKSKQPPAGTQGIVLAVPEQNLVEISIGADDGLRKGHKLEVMRAGGAYVGRIEVQQTTPDRAVCRVIPDMLRSPLQRGDRVFDKLD